MDSRPISDPILKIDGLGVSFDGQPIIKNVNFTLARGENLAIIGPNGAGKTVFLRALLGMSAYEGTLQWADDARIGYVPQKIDADRHLPITFQNLLAAKAKILRGEKSSNAASAITEVIKLAELTPKILETPVGHLSGGQFQRALIGFALLGDPNVLIFDEPTASIDTSGEQKIYELIHRLQDERGITIILVSHDLSFVYQYATKVLCLNGASMGSSGICFDTPEEALTPAVLEQLYGGKMKYVHHLHEEQR